MTDSPRPLPSLEGPGQLADRETDRSDTVADMLAVLRRRWAVLAATILACVLIAVVLHQRREETYEATASVAFNVANLSDTALGVNTSSDDPARAAATNVLIARSSEVAGGGAKQLR